MTKLLLLTAIITVGSWVGVEAYVVIADAVASIEPVLTLASF
jgi:hypothetical protein